MISESEEKESDEFDEGDDDDSMGLGDDIKDQTPKDFLGNNLSP